MLPIDRRTTLKLLGASVALPAFGGRAAAQEVQELVTIPGEKVPENLAFDADGNLYFGITAGEVRRLPADQTDETGLTLDDTEQVATLPGSVIGVEVGPDGTLYTAVVREEKPSGVWQTPTDGDSEQIAQIDGFPNDVLLDEERSRLLVSESSGGTVHAVGLDGSASVWLEDDKLDTEGFGANGLTVGPDGDVFVAVTQAPEETGRIVRVPVNDDGSAGDATMYAEDGNLFGADGLTTRGQQLYVAVNQQNTVVRITPSQEIESVATEEDGLVFPSDVLFGTTEERRDDLFICNFANETPEKAGILRTRVDQS